MFKQNSSHKNHPYKKKILKYAALIIAMGVIYGLNLKLTYESHSKFLADNLHSETHVLGISTDRTPLNMNFRNQVAVGSPLVFGGAKEPNTKHQDAWDLLQEIGVTSMRRDFWMETELPTNITLEDYKNNVNDVQNPINWNWKNGWNNINTVNSAFENAKARNMKTIAILTYAPAWLTYSGTEHGVPKDWAVYRDIVKKLYKIHRPNIDMIEIWNEPTYRNFLVLTGSPYTSRSDAYNDIYLHAIQAIREVDEEASDGKSVDIIGIVGHTPTDTSVLEGALSSNDVKNNLNAVSYHNYHIDEPSNLSYKETLEKYGLGDIPIFLTEWNYSPDEKVSNPYQTSDLALTFTAKKLVGFLNEGLAGANYFTMSENDPSKEGKMDGTFGIYRRDKNGNAFLLPQAKSWMILSKSLKLGDGDSKIFETSEPSPLDMVAFINSHNEKGIAIVNDSFNTNHISLPLSLLEATSWDTVKIFIASKDEDGTTPCTIDLIGNSVDQSLWLNIPSQSVVGITVLYNQESPLTLLRKILNSEVTNTCSILN